MSKFLKKVDRILICLISKIPIAKNKSIPSNKAFDIIRSDYRDYLDNIKDIYLKSNQELLVEKTDPICNESETKNSQCFDKKLFESVLKKMRNVSEIGYEDIDFLTSFLNNQKTKLLTNSKINSQADKTINKNEFSNSNSNMTQANQSKNQTIPAMMQQQKIPCLLSQPVFYPNPHLQQQINLVPPVPNQANSSNQIPALMSLQNQTKMMYQARVPSLMGLRPNFRSPDNLFD
ncbi:hypothetical protein BpHYR1_039760 [Brachionus plicatilis]|uniref:Uncharacterized protein n=1 Tax=Brachionus plicatilis TaxID=10195 RepID=A0A3M7SL11_BRAPC|nr:hypothetical protein BpHYR1_039760 [Brachionus plicatilis]